jgi:hypothetical protein
MADPWVFGCESLGIPCGIQIYRPPFSGIQLPSDPGCTYGSGCIEDYRRVRFHPQPTLFGDEYTAFLIRVFVYTKWDQAKGAREMYGDKLPQKVAFLGCVANNMLPSTTNWRVDASIFTDWALGKALKAIGIAGVKKAGPLATAGVAIGVTIGCLKSAASDGGH